MNTYEQFKQFADTHRGRKLCHNTYLVVREDGGFGVRLHSTEVVTHYPDRIVLDSGGWQTVTTKERMNRYSPVRVWSVKGVWYAGKFDNAVPYADQITFHADGTVTGQGEDPKYTEKLRKAVNKYAKAYAVAFTAGDVPKPSNGDCWGCLMVDKDGKGGMGNGHIHSHIEDNYFVPSILNRMADAGTLSMVAKDYIARQWQGEPREPMGTIEQEQITKTVRKFCFQELGLSS